MLALLPATAGPTYFGHRQVPERTEHERVYEGFADDGNGEKCAINGEEARRQARSWRILGRKSGHYDSRSDRRQKCLAIRDTHDEFQQSGVAPGKMTGW